MITTTFCYITLPYLTPVPVRGRLLSENRFLKVQILEQEYFLSMLPGFHEKSLEEVAFKLEYFFAHYDLNFSSINLEKKFFNLIGHDDDFLSTIEGEMLFHFEVILLGLVRTTHPDFFENNLKENLKEKSILTNDLYSEKNDFSFYKNAYCLKIKINPSSLKKTCEIINSLQEINPELIYRLDGNRRFELDELIDFSELLKKNIPSSAFLKIDYFEEPLKNFYETFLFEKGPKLKIAIDESCKIYMWQRPLLANPFVFKPSLIGLSPIFLWLRLCQNNRAIISSSFEHPTTLICLHELAKLRPEEFHGLGNYI